MKLAALFAAALTLMATPAVTNPVPGGHKIVVNTSPTLHCDRDILGIGIYLRGNRCYDVLEGDSIRSFFWSIPQSKMNKEVIHSLRGCKLNAYPEMHCQGAPVTAVGPTDNQTLSYGAEVCHSVPDFNATSFQMVCPMDPKMEDTGYGPYNEED